jgi:hypothetical protein
MGFGLFFPKELVSGAGSLGLCSWLRVLALLGMEILRVT